MIYQFSRYRIVVHLSEVRKDDMDQRIPPILNTLLAEGRLSVEAQYLQHGTTTILEHSIGVAAQALWLADHMHCRIDETALIRGALLHDYYLYDWHDSKTAPSLHGFKHPYIALKRAREDYSLNAIEENIIERHMFPLTPIPPLYMEAWLVCMADKICASKETTAPYIKRIMQVVS